MIYRRDKVKLGAITIWLSSLFGVAKDQIAGEFEVKRVEGSVCVLELNGTEFKIHKKLLNKIP